jgi:hypothetical protein
MIHVNDPGFRAVNFDQLRQTFPDGEQIGRFEVRWR